MRQTRRCKSQQCTEKNPNRNSPPEVHLEPVSSDLEGVIDARPNLGVDKGQNRFQLHRALLPEMAKVHCVLKWSSYGVVGAKKKGKYVRNMLIERVTCMIDHDAPWTYGKFGPLYLTRESRCLNCAGGRLVLLDLDIPFIDHRALVKFQVDFGRYDMAIKAVVLDNWPSQSIKL